MQADKESLGRLAYDGRGLVPAVIQDWRTGEVLMVAYMNRESLSRTLETGETWFWSRERQTLWHKGETSGHVQRVKEIQADCDYDTLLVKVEQEGGIACHEGERSCFHHPLAGQEEGTLVPGWGILDELHALIQDRQVHPKEGSYTNYLLEKGLDKVLKKVGEEATEVVIAAKNRPEEVVTEMSDLFYHLMVLLTVVNLPPERVLAELGKRRRAKASEDIPPARRI